MSRSLRIAILGTRGIPASYGGFETFAEELSTRLVERGHSVTVYGRHILGHGKPDHREYRGVLCRHTITLAHKYLETPLHALSSFIDLFFRTFDVVLLCNAANSPFAWLVKIRGFPLAINVDGIERNRSKWNSLGRVWYRIGERASVLFADRVISDARIIADYYQERYRCESELIRYGCEPKPALPGDTLKSFKLKARKYLLYVSRLEPENNALGVIQAYRKLDTDIPLVIVGDAPYAKDYINSLKESANEGVIFTGYQFGQSYRELRTNCMLYIQATEVGGTHPALVEALAYGNAIVANTTPEHEEVLGAAGAYYRKNDFDHLAELLKELINAPEWLSQMQEAARERGERDYSWDVICEQYLSVFNELERIKSQTAE